MQLAPPQQKWEELQLQLSELKAENLRLRSERNDLRDVSERQQKKIEGMGCGMRGIESQNSVLEDELMKQQSRIESLSCELSRSQQEVVCLKKELKQIKVESDAELKASISEIDKVGAIAISEINDLGRRIQDLQMQNAHQQSRIALLQKKLPETAAEHQMVEYEAMVAIDSNPLPLSQASLLEGTVEKKRKSLLWEALTAPEKSDLSIIFGRNKNSHKDNPNLLNNPELLKEFNDMKHAKIGRT